MKDVQRITTDLLIEVRDLCNANDIPYFLGPTSTGLGVLFGGHTATSLRLDVLIWAKDMERFVQAVHRDNKPERSAEYMGNNPEYPHFSIRYVNTETTFLTFSDLTGGENQGLYVEIMPLRIPGRGPGMKYLGFLESGWELRAHMNWKPKKTIHRIGKGLSSMGNRFVGNSYGEKLFHRLTKANSKPHGEKVYFKKRRRKAYDRDIFEKEDALTFEGHSFRILANPSAFLSRYYGADWEETLLLRENTYANSIYSGRVPFREVQQRLKAEGKDLQDYAARKRLMTNKELEARKYLRVYRDAILTARRSGDRLHFYEEFEARRSEIDALWKKKDLDALAVIFAEHERQVLFYLKRNLALCVNRYYADIQLALFKYEEAYEAAEKYKALLPEDHLIPLHK